MHELREQHPQFGKEKIIGIWIKKCLADDLYIRAVLDYAAANTWQSTERYQPPPQQRTLADIDAERQKVSAMIGEAAGELTFMELVMPNGKKLKHCTFKEVGAFGIMFKMLATKGKPSEIVGAKMTEAELKKILK